MTGADKIQDHAKETAMATTIDHTALLAETLRKTFDSLIAQGAHTDGEVTIIDMQSEARYEAPRRGQYIDKRTFAEALDLLIKEGILRRTETGVRTAHR
jgi:hypothetical protein